MDVTTFGGGRLSGFSDREWGWQVGAISGTSSPVRSNPRPVYQGYLTPMAQRKRFTCEGGDEDVGLSRVGKAVPVEQVQPSEVQVVEVSRPGLVLDARGVGGREGESGYCYEVLITDYANRELAKKKLGPNPTLLSLLSLPASWFDVDWLVQEASCENVGDGSWHVTDEGPVGVGLLFYTVAASVGRFGPRDLGAKVLGGSPLVWHPGLGTLPRSSDRIGAFRVSGEAAFVCDPYGSPFKRILKDPLGSILQMSMHASSPAMKPPDQVVLYRSDRRAFPNVGSCGREYPYLGFEGSTVRAAALVPRIDFGDLGVENFRMVVERPPGSRAWAVEIPFIGEFVFGVKVPGLEVELPGPAVWILTESDTVSVDLSLRGITALNFHVVDMKAALGVCEFEGPGAYSVGY